jgi:hypothetical protein
MLADIARRNTQNEIVAAQEKSDFSFNVNCFSQRKVGKVYIFISEGNSILWFLKYVSKYLEIWDKTTYRAHVCKISSTDGLNRKLQIPFCLLNIMLRPSRLPGVNRCVFRRAISAISLHNKKVPWQWRGRVIEFYWQVRSYYKNGNDRG